MDRFLASLRNKPKEIRSQYAFGAAVTCTAVFFLVWLSGVSERMALEPAASSPVETAPVAQEKVETTAGSLFGQLRRGAAALIFNAEPSAEEPSAAPTAPRTLDINALVTNPPPPRPSAPAATVTEEESPTEEFAPDTPQDTPESTDTLAPEPPNYNGQVILIATSSATTTE